VFALVDCNSFFASCEQIFRPDLEGKPVVVLSNNDGCIVARNKEAKALGIPDLHAYFKVRDYLEAHQVNVFSSNYELYADTSNRVIQVLEYLAPEVEVYSIDESFLLLDGFNVDWYVYGEEIINTLWQYVRMPVCVGFAPTRTLSKLANHIAKKSNRLNGVCAIEDISDWHNVFKKLPVSKIWGVGGRTAKRLSYLDIHSVYDLKRADPKYIRKQFNVNLERTIAELNGERCIELDIYPKDKQRIFSTRSFGERVRTLEGLHQSVSQYASTAADKLRDQDSLCSTVLAFIETSRFDDKPYKASYLIPLEYPTNDTRIIIKAAKDAVSKVYRTGYPYAKAGVGLLDIIDRNPTQLNIFNQYQTQQSIDLMKAMDKLNKHSKQVFFGSSGIDPFWRMQRNLKSPAYTTRLSDLPQLKVM